MAASSALPPRSRTPRRRPRRPAYGAWRRRPCAERASGQRGRERHAAMIHSVSCYYRAVAAGTTIAGSLLKPPWLAEPERLWARWRLPPETLAEGQRDAVLAALKDQETAGIDVVTDGEQRASTSSTASWSGSRGSTSPAASPSASGPTATRPRCPTVTGPLARRSPNPRGRGQVGPGPHRPSAEVHDPGADDHRRHPGRRALS